MRPRNTFAPTLEALDDRALMSVTLTNGLLEVVGTTGPDLIRAFLPTPDTVRITINSTGDDETFNLADITGFLLRSRGGDDFIMVGPNILIRAEFRGWTGNDVIRGGGGGDTILAGDGNDQADGRGGNDSVNGGEGDDSLQGGDGDDTLDGGGGANLVNGGAGTNTTSNGIDTGTTLAGTFNIPGGAGVVDFSFGPGTQGLTQQLTLSVQNLGVPFVPMTFAIDGAQIARIDLDATGSGSTTLEYNFDQNGDGTLDFLQGLPVDFPNIDTSSVATVAIGGLTVLNDTIANLLGGGGIPGG